MSRYWFGWVAALCAGLLGMIGTPGGRTGRCQLLRHAGAVAGGTGIETHAAARPSRRSPQRTEERMFEHLNNDVVLRTVAMAQAGDNDAFDDLATWVRPDLRAYLTTFFPGDDQTIEDVIQDTLVRAWVRLRSFDANNPVVAVGMWLIRIAQNRAIDVIRQCRRRQTFAVSVIVGWFPDAQEMMADEFDLAALPLGLTMPMADDADQPDAALARMANRTAAVDVIRRLWPSLSERDARTLAALERWYDCPPRQGDGVAHRVAAELGIGRSATKSAILRARLNARQSLAWLGLMGTT